MEESTLLFRHLPSELTQEERKNFLHHIGAKQVRLMGVSGPLKNTAFVVFENNEKAKEVVNQLHQTEFLGSTLVVEFAQKKGNSIPSLIDNEGAQVVEKDEDGEKEKSLDSTKTRNASELKFDTSFNNWGLHHPRRPELRYLYPPPSPSILTNIMHALATVPKFYVQVLHLMNKMDLPAPFGMVTLKPPISNINQDHVQVSSVADDTSQKEMDISSSSESELSSSDTDEEREKVNQQEKRQRAMLKAKFSYGKSIRSDHKKPRLSDLQDIAISVSSKNPAMAITDVFEQSNDSGPAKKIEMKIAGTIKPPSLVKGKSRQPQSSLYNPSEPTMPLQPPPLTSSKTSDTFPSDGVEQFPIEKTLSRFEDYPDLFTGSFNQEEQKQTELHQDSVPQGFGIIEPQIKETKQDEEEESTEKAWVKTKFISSSELRKSRLSSREMKDLSVFKRYSAGEPSCRLYIKNLAKQVSEEDLHWVFGRYVNWDNEIETNIFDIRLMKEGRMKGQSFITLPNEDAAKSAVKDINGFVFKDKPMVVQFARSAKAEEDKASKI